ncbi:STAS domain-containing protein [Pseudonocardia sp. TRM90224]|uniref:STAS domain-containing protein n=1 Tax=Pseudonocardia sp. TRM90224 TaxID=2812678 RepID=UPI001E5116AD|nr:STAS domain-containing protein [Pseudonocardia sp. TRM90224]
MTRPHDLEEPHAGRAAVESLPIEERVVNGAVIVLRPVGEIDMVTVDTLRDRLTAELGRRQHVVLDCSDVQFLSSGGIQALVEAHRQAQAAGAALHIAGAASRVVARPLEITGVDTVLTISADPPDELGDRLAAH